jgi:hypothetical protein
MVALGVRERLLIGVISPKTNSSRGMAYRVQAVTKMAKFMARRCTDGIHTRDLQDQRVSNSDPSARALFTNLNQNKI